MRKVSKQAPGRA